MGWGGAEYQYPLANRWRLRSGFNVNHREYKGGQFDQTFLGRVRAGPRWLFSRDTEMSLLATASQRWWGGSPFNYDFRRASRSGAPGLTRAFATERPGVLAGPDKPAAEVPGRVAHRILPWVPILRALSRSCRSTRLLGFQQQDALAHHWNSHGLLGAGGDERGLALGLYRGCSAPSSGGRTSKAGGRRSCPTTPPAMTTPGSWGPRS